MQLRDDTTAWSISVGYGYRAMAVIKKIESDKIYLWFWIGSHEDYNNLLK